MKRVVICTLILVLLITLTSTTVLAINTEPYHLKLLAVQENGEEQFQGSDADLFLELKAGSGRVFLDTFPLTKMDTQISTRFAKEIACKHYKLDCDQYDFIYTIKAKSNIIGGPSAGAAVSALTAIAMLGLEYDEDVTITGTINSGSTVGPVGGVKEKLEAASKSGLKKVLIAQGTSKQKSMHPVLDTKVTVVTNDTIESNKTEETNESTESPVTNSTNTTTNSTESDNRLDLIEYSKNNLSLEVVEVANLDDVVFQLTGVDLNHKEFNISEDDEYRKIMQGLQQVLCSRSEEIELQILGSEYEISEDILNQSQEKEKNVELALAQEDYYSAASFCFGNNILLRSHYYQEKNMTNSTISELFKRIEVKVKGLETKIDEEKIETISDLQTVMITKERLSDVKLQLESFNESKTLISNQEAASLLAYTEERFFSALSWMQFFSMNGKKFVLEKQELDRSCLQKISEADERYQYASIYLGLRSVINIKNKIDLAKDSFSKGDPELCLIKAAQAKAEANAILSSLGLDKDSMDDFLVNKNNAVERVIFENSQEQIFPLVGYSYYQYGNSLKEDNPYTALIYFEYALEMSDLEIYFPEETSIKENFINQIREVFDFESKSMVFLLGLALGIILTLIIVFTKEKLFKKYPHLVFIRKNK